MPLASPPLLHGPLTELLSAVHVTGLHVVPDGEQPWQLGIWLVNSSDAKPAGAPKWSTAISASAMTLHIGSLGQHQGRWLVAVHAPIFFVLDPNGVPGPGATPLPTQSLVASPAVKIDPTPATLPPPILSEGVDRGATCVAISGVVPGAMVDVRVAGVSLGTAEGGAAGKVCVPLDWAGASSASTSLTAAQYPPPLSLFANGVAAACLIRGRLLVMVKPRVVEPVLACQH